MICKKAELTVDGNSSAGKGSRPPRSESAGSPDPPTNFIAVAINQLDKTALTSLIGLLGPQETLVVGLSPRLREVFRKTLETLDTVV